MKNVCLGTFTLLMLLLISCNNTTPTENDTTEKTPETTEAVTQPVAEEKPAAPAGYKVGDIAADFNLKNVDGNMISLESMNEAKGFVVVFTCNHCPYAIDYEDRLIALNDKYSAQGYPVVAINPNDPAVVEEDSYEQMIVRAKEKGFTFPYLFDEGQTVYPKYGATKTPHVYLLQKTEDGNKVAYIGAIDDSRKAGEVSEKYLENALEALLKGETPKPDFTAAFGCSIKAKKG